MHDIKLKKLLIVLDNLICQRRMTVMLTISRKSGESFKIGDDIEVFVNKTDNEQVKVTISAPKELRILRSELLVSDKIKKDC